MHKLLKLFIEGICIILGTAFVLFLLLSLPEWGAYQWIPILFLALVYLGTVLTLSYYGALSRAKRRGYIRQDAPPYQPQLIKRFIVICLIIIFVSGAIMLAGVLLKLN
jgi:hypothetical protein